LKNLAYFTQENVNIAAMTPIDAPEADYLYKEISGLPDAGQGLYTAIKIYKDEIIALYKGEILTDTEAEKRITSGTDQYFINMLDGRIMDSMKTRCFAKYANDAAGKANSGLKNNAKISIDEEENICLVAIKNISPGEEIFCSYGKKYWKKHN
jgi:SET domain-containing protein